jgi:hypothetical protein
MEIALSHGLVALVDEEDYPRVNQWKWKAYKQKNGTWCVQTWMLQGDGKRRTVRMRRFIDQTPCGYEVININGDAFDNRRSNLRRCTRAERLTNRRLQRNNTSGFKGVSFHKQNSMWQANINAGGKYHSLGYFETPEAASKVYEAAAKRLHGELYRPPELRTPLRKRDPQLEEQSRKRWNRWREWEQAKQQRRWTREEWKQRRQERIESGELVWTPGDAFDRAISLDALSPSGERFYEFVIDKSQRDPLEILLEQEAYAEASVMAGAKQNRAV